MSKELKNGSGILEEFSHAQFEETKSAAQLGAAHQELCIFDLGQIRLGA